MPLSKLTTDQIRKEMFEALKPLVSHYDRSEEPVDYEPLNHIKCLEAVQICLGFADHISAVWKEKAEGLEKLLKDFVSITKTRWKSQPHDSFEKKTLNAATTFIEQFK